MRPTRSFVVSRWRRLHKNVVKSKSMVTEEIHLNDALQASGVEVIETDLGEYIIQLAGGDREAGGRRQF